MIIKNWMQKETLTICGDMSAREAKAIFDDRKPPFIPVVDDGRLRGILTRKDVRQHRASRRQKAFMN